MNEILTYVFLYFGIFVCIFCCLSFLFVCVLEVGGVCACVCGGGGGGGGGRGVHNKVLMRMSKGAVRYGTLKHIDS